MSRPVDPEFVRRVPLVRRLLVGLAALAAVEAALLIVQISALSTLIVHLFGAHRSLASLTSDLLLLAAAGIGRSGVGGLREWVSRRSSTTIRGDLRMKAATALARLGSASSPGWVGGRSSGDLGSALGPGLDRADGYLTRALPALVSASVIPPILIGRLFLADIQSGVVVLVLLPLVPLFMALIGVTTRRHTQRQLAQLNHLSGRFLDLVQGLSSLRIYGRAHDQQRAVLASSERYRRTTVDVLKTALLSGLVLDLLTTLSIAVVAVDIGLRVDHGSLGLGVALLVLLLMPEIFAPVRNVGAQYHANLDGQAAIGTVLEVLAAADEAALPGEATLHARHTGRFTVHRVKVAHGSRSELSLDLDHLVIDRGECVALTGRSGAGKSTLLSVLLGFTAPTSGTVLVDSSGGVQPQRGVDPDEWRAGIAWVPQHPRPTQPTVADEVRLGDPSASPADVVRALADCNAPAASTPLDEDGRNTSAGQRRRIALARALLRARAVAAHGNTPLVLLDEPSEDLDQATEQIVARVISELSGWATIVMVTHSRRLVAIADREIRLADGHIESDQRVNRRQPIANSSAELGGSALVTHPAAGILVAPSVAAPVAAPQWHWRTLVRPARRGLAAAIAFSCLAGLAGLALMATSNWLILRAAQHPNVQALSIAVVGVRLFALTRPLARYAERMSGHDAALRLMSSLRSQVFDALIPLVPLRGAHLRRGELLRNFVADVDGVQDAIVRLVVPLAGAVATAAASVTVASLISPRAGLVLAIALSLAFAAAILSSHRADVRSGSAVAAAAGRRDRLTIALVESLPELTAYGATGAALIDLAASEETVLRAARREASTAAVGSVLTGSITSIGLVGTLAAAGSAGLSGPAIGGLLACALIGAEAVGAVPATVAAYGRLRGQLDRVMRLLATEPTRVDPAIPAAVPSGSLGMLGEGLTVSPSPAARFVLSDAVVTVRPGERTVVVGPSGSGKSTLLATLLGLLSATEGSLRITGDTESVALDSVTEQDLRPRVAGSLQGDHVFDVSLRDNLRFVRPSADDDELDDVARRAGLGDFIKSLPDGWATPAGPDGSALSGGQRQRLLLARALLADPDILILDEPTAHLDEETEAAVLADLTRATNGRTVVMSSHRPASLVGAGHVSRVAEGTVS